MIIDYSFELRMESGGFHAHFEGIITFLQAVEAGALPNLHQTYARARAVKKGVRSVYLLIMRNSIHTVTTH